MKTKISLVLVIAVLVGLFIIFKPGCKAPVKPVIISTDVIAKVEKKVLDEALKKVDSLQDKIFSIEAKAAMDEVQLPAEQTRARIIEKYFIKKVIVKADTVEDTSKEYFSFEDLVANSQARDSLCNSIIAKKDTVIKSLKEIVIQKDTIIQAVKKSNSILVTQQNDLLKYSKELNSKFKGVKFGSRVWRIGAVAAGIYILKSIITK